MPAIGTTWNSLDGVRTIVREGTMPDGSSRFGVATEGRPNLELFRPDEVDRQIARETESFRRSVEVRAAKEAATAALAVHRADLDRFLEQFPQLAGAKANASLMKRVMWSRVYLPRHEHVEQRVAQGWHVETTPKGERRFCGPDGRFLTEKDATKIALDYAEFLAGGRSGGKRRSAPQRARKATTARKAHRGAKRPTRGKRRGHGAPVASKLGALVTDINRLVK